MFHQVYRGFHSEGGSLAFFSRRLGISGLHSVRKDRIRWDILTATVTSQPTCQEHSFKNQQFRVPLSHPTCPCDARDSLISAPPNTCSVKWVTTARTRARPCLLNSRKSCFRIRHWCTPQSNAPCRMRRRQCRTLSSPIRAITRSRLFWGSLLRQSRCGSGTKRRVLVVTNGWYCDGWYYHCHSQG